MSSRNPPRDFIFEVRKLNVSGHESDQILAHDDNIGTNAQTLWAENSLYVFPSTATQMTVSSSSANDTAAGSGARAVLIDYLDADYVANQELVTLNGTTGVTTTASMLRINKLRVVSSGGSETNAGNIYVGTGLITNGRPLNVYRVIHIGEGIDRNPVYTAPANKQLFYQTLVFSSFTASRLLNVRLFVKIFGTSTWLLTQEYHLSASTFERTGFTSRGIPAKSDIRVDGNVTSQTADCSGGISFILVNQNEMETRV